MSTIRYEQVYAKPTETDELLCKKIAYTNSTIPEYIAIVARDESNITYNIITDIAGGEEYGGVMNYNDFFERTSKIWDKLSPMDNFKVWLLVRGKQFFSSNTFELVMIFSAFPKLKCAFSMYKDEIPILLNGKFSKIVQEETEKKKDFNRKYKKELEQIKQFYKLKSIRSTTFTLDRSTFSIGIEKSGQNNIMDIFNELSTNINVPFICCNGYYKIDENFIPPDEWLVDLVETDVIMMKVLSREYYNEKKILEIYTDAEVRLRDNIEIIASTITNKGIDQNKTIERIRSVFNMNFITTAIVDKSIAGTYFYPQFEINMDIFSDLVMNNSMFSRYLKIDENMKLQKKKAQAYVYFLDPDLAGPNDSNQVTANITNQIVERRDIAARQYGSELFPIDSKYLRIRITKAKNRDSLEIFVNVMNKLLSLYTDREQDVADFYKLYGIQLIKEVKIVRTTTKKYLKDTDPDIFGPLSNYTRQCIKAREPSIVSESEAKELQSKGYAIMKFPKDGAPGTQHYFVCNKNKTYRYPGVKENVVAEHAKKYPYLPCCFSDDQTQKDKYKKYFENLMVEDQAIVGRVIQGVKFLQYRQLGELPSNIKTVLESNSDKYQYYRSGVHRTKNSAIECILDAFDVNFRDNIVNSGMDTITQYIEDIRTSLTQDIDCAVIKQENYEHSVNEIVDNIMDQNTYFDPKRYIKLLEIKYQCNIYLFGRHNNEGQFLLPRHAMNYIRFNQIYPKTVLLYEHMGSEDTDAEYPQCELIIMTPIAGGRDISVIEPANEQYDSMNDLYNELTTSYSLNYINRGIRQDRKLFPSIFSQYIDKYGKTRIINIMYNRKSISIATQPLPNFSVPVVTFDECNHVVELNVVMDFLKHMNGKIIKKSCDIVDKEKQCREIHVIIGDIKGIINIMYTGTRIDQDLAKSPIPTALKQFNIQTTVSKLDEFRHKKHIAHILEEYTLWLFSKFLYQRYPDLDLDGLLYGFDMNKINEFVMLNFIEIPNYDYGVVDARLSMDSSILRDGKLIIGSGDPSEMTKRLIYCIMLNISREPAMINGGINMNNIKNYKDRIIVNQSFTAIDDFKKWENQLIFSDINHIKQWIVSEQQKLVLSDTILMDSKYPYLIQNKELTDNEIVLANNTDKILYAYNQAYIWNTEHYNTGANIILTEPIGDFNLYSYQNGDTVTKHIIGNESNINIAGYLEDDTPRYTTLLSFS